jgi:hypothetical protein
VVGVDAVETDEPRSLALVGEAAETPLCAASVLPDPVDGSEGKVSSGVDAERPDPFGVIGEAEFPAGRDEIVEEVFPFVPGEVEPSEVDDLNAEPFDVVNVVQG